MKRNKIMKQKRNTNLYPCNFPPVLQDLLGLTGGERGNVFPALSNLLLQISLKMILQMTRVLYSKV